MGAPGKERRGRACRGGHIMAFSATYTKNTMLANRFLPPLDQLIVGFDKALRVVGGVASASRPNPAAHAVDCELDERESRHSAGLMRVNHVGEVCAQALYQGQALTAKLPSVRKAMERAADEEIDHLAWCEQRIRQLNSHPSVLNPLFYGMSFGIGAFAGLVSDKVSLGFVAATEHQVCKHLDEHLVQIPAEDEKSRAILEQMRVDEEQHADAALQAGGYRFPAPVRFGMSLLADRKSVV